MAKYIQLPAGSKNKIIGKKLFIIAKNERNRNKTKINVFVLKSKLNLRKKNGVSRWIAPL